MPEHVHLLVWPIDPREAAISEFLKTLKLSCSTKIKHRLIVARSPLLDRLTVTERPGKRVFRFWQEGPGYDRNLDRPRDGPGVDRIHPQQSGEARSRASRSRMALVERAVLLSGNRVFAGGGPTRYTIAERVSSRAVKLTRQWSTIEGRSATDRQ